MGDLRGDAVVEATVLFPVMTMIFAALVLLAIYMPSRAVLQRATQYAATALATELSDTWLFFNENNMVYYRHTDKRQLQNVYAGLFEGFNNDLIQTRSEIIVTHIEKKGISVKAGLLKVDGYITDNILYKEVVVTATREIPIAVDLSFIGFPKIIPVTATSSAVALNAEEFIRNIDIAGDFASYIASIYGLNNIIDAISSFGSRIAGLLGW